MLALAIVLISLALVSYTTGVLAERKGGTLRPWHAVAFGIGLLFDAIGTALMSVIARSGATLGRDALSRGLSTVMAVTGAAALILMAVHLVWAIVVLRRNRAQEKRTFHRFSLGVWLLWLVPYCTGMAAAMVG